MTKTNNDTRRLDKRDHAGITKVVKTVKSGGILVGVLGTIVAIVTNGKFGGSHKA